MFVVAPSAPTLACVPFDAFLTSFASAPTLVVEKLLVELLRLTLGESIVLPAVAFAVRSFAFCDFLSSCENLALARAAAMIQGTDFTEGRLFLRVGRLSGLGGGGGGGEGFLVIFGSFAIFAFPLVRSITYGSFVLLLVTALPNVEVDDDEEEVFFGFCG